jgi:hypothetical protein
MLSAVVVSGNSNQAVWPPVTTAGLPQPRRWIRETAGNWGANESLTFPAWKLSVGIFIRSSMTTFLLLYLHRA